MVFRGFLACLVASLGLSWPAVQDARAIVADDHASIDGTATCLVSPGVSCQEEALTAGPIERSSLLPEWSRPLAFVAAFVGTGNPVALAEVFPAFPELSSAPAATTHVTAQLPEQVAKTPETQISEVVSIAGPNDTAFEAAVTGMASQFSADVTPSTLAPVTESIAAAPVPAPTPAEPVCAAQAAPVATAPSVDAVVAQGDEAPTSAVAETQSSIEVASATPDPLPALAPAPAETIPVVTVPEAVPAIVPPVDTVVAYDPFDPYPGLAFALNRANDALGLPTELPMAAQTAPDSPPATLVLKDTPEVVAPVSPETQAIAQAEIAPVPPGPAPEAAPAGVTTEPEVTPEPNTTAPVTGTSERATEVSAAPEMVMIPVVEAPQRDERIASAVRLTGEAIQAWAAVLSDRHDLASVPTPVTR